MSDVAIPDGWQQVKLGDVCILNPSVPIKRGSSYAYVDMASIDVSLRFTSDDCHREFGGGGSRFQSGDTLMARITPCLENGKIAQVRSDSPCGFGSTEFIVFRAVPHCTDANFIYYLVKGPELRSHAVSNMSGTSGRQRVPTEAMRILDILLPPLHEQKAIAHILGSLDDKIDQLRKTNTVLEDMASALFKSWFVDFDPVKAKQENRPTGLPKDLDELFPDSFEDSVLGPIPKGWRVSKTGDELTVVGGTTPSTSNPSYWDGGSHYWATPKDLSEQKLPIISSTSRLVTDQGLATISSRLLDPGTVLLSSRAPVGYLAVTEVPVAINQGFIAIKVSSTTPTGFIYEWCKSNIEEFIKRSSGTTFLELSKSSFRQIPIVMPEADVVLEYECHHTGLFKRVSANIHQIRTITNLRDTPLPKLISGELRVPDAEQMVAKLGI